MHADSKEQKRIVRRTDGSKLDLEGADEATFPTADANTPSFKASMCRRAPKATARGAKTHESFHDMERVFAMQQSSIKSLQHNWMITIMSTNKSPGCTFAWAGAASACRACHSHHDHISPHHEITTLTFH
jgi:hypothetical protein